MLLQPAGLGGRLHLDDRDARPDQVEEASRLRLLEGGDGLPILPVAVEQLVQEGLRLGPL